jgi:hypothetical protein
MRLTRDEVVDGNIDPLASFADTKAVDALWVPRLSDEKPFY